MVTTNWSYSVGYGRVIGIAIRRGCGAGWVPTLTLFCPGSVPAYMQRPRLHESTITAIDMTVEEITDFEADTFDMDTKIRMILYNYAKKETNDDYGHSLGMVMDYTEKFDL